jgi:hypothetical protein
MLATIEIPRELKVTMIDEARLRDGYDIYPPSQYKDLFDCFTEYNGDAIFWYNVPTHTTKMLRRKITEN